MDWYISLCKVSPIYKSDLMKASLTNDYPPQKQWHLMTENYSAARRALYAAKAQLG